MPSRALRILFLVGIGHAAFDRRHHLGRSAPGDLRRDRRGIELTLRSNIAPGSERSVRQCATRAVPQFAGRRERPALEVANGRLVDADHARARARFDRHVAHRHPAFHRQRANRAAVEFDRVAGAAGGADPADDRPARCPSAVQPNGSVPSTLTRIDFAFLVSRHCVASTCSTSEVPMPKARQANAPCVLVCESPQTTVMPGSVAPVLGADHVHDALTLVAERKVGLGAVLAHVGVERVDLACARSDRRCRRSQCCVGVLWSAVATIELTRQGLRPASFNPSNACGLVTSWTRWRSM